MRGRVNFRKYEMKIKKSQSFINTGCNWVFGRPFSNSATKIFHNFSVAFVVGSRGSGVDFGQ